MNNKHSLRFDDAYLTQHLILHALLKISSEKIHKGQIHAHNVNQFPVESEPNRRKA